MPSSIIGRLAGAPISWGVCEVPDWGEQLPANRVLAEMAGLGLTATEAGPVGYLGDDARQVVSLLDTYGLHLIGGFVPVVLHDAAQLAPTMEAVRRSAELFEAAAARFLVSAVVVDQEWSAPRPLDRSEWRRVFDGLSRLDELAGEHGLTQVVHPHWGTLLERRDDVLRLLDGCDVLLCLDTGHLSLGGTDPVELATDVADRVAHVHVKDVSTELSERLRSGALDYVPAVQQGLFRLLGTGGARVADTVTALEDAGYDGWYVLEQDLSLASADVDPNDGPTAEVRRSIEFLETVADARS